MADETVFGRDRRIRNARLTMGQTFYLCTLNQFIGKNSDAWPAQAKIAERMNASLRSVKYWQTELEQMGVIVVASGKGCKMQNRYSLRLDALQIKPTLNSATIAPFDTEIESEWGNHCPNNGATIALGIGQPLPTERTMKEQLKEQAFSFPEKLNSPEFSEAWLEWAKYKAETKKKLTPSTRKKQLAKLADFGSAKAVRSIELSIENGWQGLFDPDQRNGKASSEASPEALAAWQTVLDSLQRHSRFKSELIQADIGERAWHSIKGFTLKKLDEANKFDRGELEKRFVQEFNRQKST